MEKGRLTALFKPDGVYTRHSEGAFLRMKDGALMFAYSRFTGAWFDDAPSDIVFCVSRDEGETWTEPDVMLSAASFGVKNIMSLSLLRMENGDLGALCIAKEPPQIYRVYLSRSADEGKTFYKRIDCLENVGQGHYVVNNARVIRLKSGRLILPLAHHRSDGRAKSGENAHIDYRASGVWVYSDDDGESWLPADDVVFPPFTGSKTGLQEPGVIEKQSGALWGFYRTDMGFQYETFSMDGGLHWTAAQPSRFTSPVSPMSMARHASGRLYAVWNPIPEYNGRAKSSAGWGRTPLVMAHSDDDGASWSEPEIIEEEEGHGYCYTALFFTRDNALLAAYCSGGPEEGACLARLSIRKIELE